MICYLNVFLLMTGVTADVIRAHLTRKAQARPRYTYMRLQVPNFTTAAPRKRSGQTYREVMQNWQDLNTEYHSVLQVGTPGQKMTVIMDTGSSNLWVPRQKVGEHDVYDHKTSSSYMENGTAFQIDYVSGSFSGVFSQDLVSIVPALVIQNYTFAEVDTASMNAEDLDFDGICGLGWPADSVGKVVTPMEAIVASGKLERPVFGFYLADGGPGELVFGGVDPNHIEGDFTYHPLISKKHWEVRLNGIKFPTNDWKSSAFWLRFSDNDHSAIVDSGSSQIVGPIEEVRVLMEALGAVTYDYLGYRTLHYIDRTKELHPLVFILDGKPFTLKKEDLIVDCDNEQMFVGNECLLGISGMDMGSGTQWIFGDVFMRRYYVEFDWGQARLGIAPSRSRASFLTAEARSDVGVDHFSITLVAAVAALMVLFGGLAVVLCATHSRRVEEDLAPYLMLA